MTNRQVAKERKKRVRGRDECDGLQKEKYPDPLSKSTNKTV